LKHPDIVIAQVARFVRRPVEVNALRLEELLVDAQMERLGVTPSKSNTIAAICMV
jgi:hypothetical protein